VYNEIIEPRGLSSDDLLCALPEACGGGRELRGHQSPKDASKAMRDTPVEQLTPKDRDVLQKFASSTKNKIVFVAREGHVRLTYHPDAVEGIRAGDEVAVLFGLNIPFVLRKAEEDNGVRYVFGAGAPPACTLPAETSRFCHS
jgi:hypothetical protein